MRETNWDSVPREPIFCIGWFHIQQQIQWPFCNLHGPWVAAVLLWHCLWYHEGYWPLCDRSSESGNLMTRWRLSLSLLVVYLLTPLGSFAAFGAMVTKHNKLLISWIWFRAHYIYTFSMIYTEQIYINCTRYWLLCTPIFSTDIIDDTIRCLPITKTAVLDALNIVAFSGSQLISQLNQKGFGW